MKRFNAQSIFQLLMIVTGLVVGVCFSVLSNDSHHGELHSMAHPASHHGTLSIDQDDIIPSIKQLVLTKDPMSGWNLFIDTENFRFSPDHVGTAHVPGEGHAHLYINGQKVARLYSPWFYLPATEDPMLEIKVTLNANSHEVMQRKGKSIALSMQNLGLEKNIAVCKN